MYLGHIGLALGARTADRRVPVAVFIAAAVAPDLLPSRAFHYLALAPVVVVGVAAVTEFAWRSRRATVAVALLAASHYVADFVTAGVRVWAGKDSVGLSLYDRPVADLVVETATIVVGWWLWQRGASRRAPDRQRVTLAVLAVLVVMQTVFSLFVAERLLD